MVRGRARGEGYSGGGPVSCYAFPARSKVIAFDTTITGVVCIDILVYVYTRLGYSLIVDHVY